MKIIMADDHLDKLIEHANRCWLAETENAQRQVVRVNLMLTVTVALFGLGLFRIEWLRSADAVLNIPPVAAVMIKIFLWLGVLYLVLAIKPLGRRREPPRTLHASEALTNIPNDIISDAAKADSIETRTAIFWALWDGVLDLQSRNTKRSEDIDEANKLVAKGLLLVILAVFVYSWASGQARLPECEINATEQQSIQPAATSESAQNSEPASTNAVATSGR